LLWPPSKRSRSEQIARFVGKRFAIIYSIGDNAQRQGYGMGSRFGLGVPIGENARKRWDFGDPTPIVFALEFNLEHADPSVAVAALCATANGECTVSLLTATIGSFVPSDVIVPPSAGHAEGGASDRTPEGSPARESGVEAIGKGPTTPAVIPELSP
jgi:hypothetical protein